MPSLPEATHRPPWWGETPVEPTLPAQFRLVSLSFQPEGNRAARQQVSFTVAAMTTLPLYEIKPADVPGERPFLLREVTGVHQAVTLTGTMTAVGSASEWTYTGLRWEPDPAVLGRLAAELPRGLLVEGTPAAKAELAARQKAREEAAERERQRKEELARQEAERQAERERLAKLEEERREAAEALRKQQAAELAERRKQEQQAREQAEAERQAEEEAGLKQLELRRRTLSRDVGMMVFGSDGQRGRLVFAQIELVPEERTPQAPPLEAQVFLDTGQGTTDKLVVLNKAGESVRLLEVRVSVPTAADAPQITRRQITLAPNGYGLLVPGRIELGATVEIFCEEFADPARLRAVVRPDQPPAKN